MQWQPALAILLRCFSTAYIVKLLYNSSSDEQANVFDDTISNISST